MKNKTLKDNHSLICALTLCLLALFLADKTSAGTVWLDDLDISKTTQGWGDPHKNQSVEGNALSLQGKTFDHGLGTHADSILYVRLGGAAKSFSATVGLDDEVRAHP